MASSIPNYRALRRVLRPGESGGALVETALTMPLLVILVLGAVELARVAYAAIEVSNAARAAVSYGAAKRGHSFRYGRHYLGSDARGCEPLIAKHCEHYSFLHLFQRQRFNGPEH